MIYEKYILIFFLRLLVKCFLLRFLVRICVFIIIFGELVCFIVKKNKIVYFSIIV